MGYNATNQLFNLQIVDLIIELVCGTIVCQIRLRYSISTGNLRDWDFKRSSKLKENTWSAQLFFKMTVREGIKKN